MRALSHVSHPEVVDRLFGLGKETSEDIQLARRTFERQFTSSSNVHDAVVREQIASFSIVQEAMWRPKGKIYNLFRRTRSQLADDSRKRVNDLVHHTRSHVRTTQRADSA